MTRLPTIRRHSIALVLLWLAGAAPAFAAVGTLFPLPWFTALDAAGNPVAGAKACFYIAGTSTPATTYVDVNLTSANTNPVTADSAGRLGPIYLSPGASYKLILQDATGTAGTCNGTVIRTQDAIAAVPASATSDVTGTAGEALPASKVVYLSDGSGGKTAGQWYLASAAAASSSTTPQIGMTPVAIAMGSAGTIRLSGSVSGLSVTTGANYYVATAGAGAMQTPAPAAFQRQVGQADTPSSIILVGSPSFAVFYAGTATFSGPTNFLGKVGLGNVSPVSTLDIFNSASTSGNPLVLISNQYSGTSVGVEIDAGHSSDDYALRVRSKSGTDILYVEGDSRVGIGTTAPTTTLDVNGNTNVTGATTITGATGLILASATPTTPILDLYDSTRLVETVLSSYDGATAGTYLASFTSHPLMLSTNHTTAQVTLTTAGAFTLTNSTLKFRATDVIVGTGGGSAATFIATGVGGTGQPTTAAQNGWIKMLDSTGATVWLPTWKYAQARSRLGKHTW